MTETTSQHVPQSGEKVLFITGRLAEGVTRRVVEKVSQQMNFHGDVHVAGISVAALMHVDWLLRKLTNEPEQFDSVFLPGWCQGDVSKLSERYKVPFYIGPKDILDLAQYFGKASRAKPDLQRYDIEIIAEINHAPRMTEQEILRIAEHYRRNGADLIDIGCIPGESWTDVSKIVQLLRREGFRISIDSFDQAEVGAAIAAGAELVLSCNQSNVEWLSKFGVDVVVIPDDPAQIQTMWETAETLQAKDCPFRLDPILEPIGFGFAESLARYYDTRRFAPDAPIMMGIGNLTEMTEVDSAGVNTLLAAICQELEIFSVLTTEVIPWCQSAVKEFDVARRLVRHAVRNQALPKHVTSDLVLLRDVKDSQLGDDALQIMASEIRDANYRIFVEGEQIHIMNRDGYWKGSDPFELFDDFAVENPKLDISHAFYLGYELSKAVTALTLGKQYRQDQSLHWGFLTIPEQSAHERKRSARANRGNG